MLRRNKLLLVFWIALIVFLGWDWLHSVPVNHRLEPALLAAGSGQAPSGAHCSAF